MELGKILYLTRDDLIAMNTYKGFWLIEEDDFRKEALKRIENSSIVLFIDDDQRSKLLKDRGNIIKSVLSNYFNTNTLQVHPNKVFQKCLEQLKVSDKDVKSKSRKVHLVRARAIICILLIEIYGYGTNTIYLSLEQIGTYVNRDHATVYAYWKNHRFEKEIKEAIKIIKSNL